MADWLKRERLVGDARDLETLAPPDDDRLDAETPAGQEEANPVDRRTTEQEG